MRTGDSPLYHGLAQWLLNEVRSGALQAGARVPSEHELAKRFGISRPTVRQATELLVRRGVLERRRGSGTFVRRPPPAVDLFSLAGTQRAFQDQGIEIECEFLVDPSEVRVPLAADNPFAGQAVIHVARVSRLERTPVLLEYIYLCSQLFAPLLGADLEGASLSEWVSEHLMLRPSSAEQRFNVVPVRGKQARALGVAAGTQLLFVQRYLHFAKQMNAVFVELYCRTEHMTFSQIIQGAADA